MKEFSLSSLQKFIDAYGMRILNCAIILVIGYLFMKLLLKLIRKSLKKTTKIDVTAHRFIYSTIHILLWVLLGIIVLDTFGIPMTSLIAVFSITGLAVSLAVKDSLSHVAGGIILLFSKPFTVGDYVQIDNQEGTVSYINILYTKLNTVDNKAIYIPNGLISADKIVNFTHEDKRRLDFIVPISYQDDFRAAEKIISDIIAQHPMAEPNPEPLVRLSEFADSSINLSIKIWVKSECYWHLKYDLLESIKEEFDKTGIEIPYNQLDVHIQTDHSNQEVQKISLPKSSK